MGGRASLGSEGLSKAEQDRRVSQCQESVSIRYGPKRSRVKIRLKRNE
jgi:hypothetical protein